MGTPIRTVVDDYLVSLEESGLSAATVSSYRTDLNRLVRVSETLQATAEDVLEAVGDPATTPLGRRRRRYDTINNYKRSLYRLVDVAPTLPADDDQIYEALGDPEEFKPNTRRQRYAALSTFFTSKTAKDLGLTNSMPGITRPPNWNGFLRTTEFP